MVALTGPSQGSSGVVTSTSTNTSTSVYRWAFRDENTEHREAAIRHIKSRARAGSFYDVYDLPYLNYEAHLKAGISSAMCYLPFASYRFLLVRRTPFCGGTFWLLLLGFLFGFFFLSGTLSFSRPHPPPCCAHGQTCLPCSLAYVPWGAAIALLRVCVVSFVVLCL